MCNTDEMCMNIQMSKYQSDYFGVNNQVFNDTKENKMITFNITMITHTPAGENQIINITHMPAGQVFVDAESFWKVRKLFSH